MIIREFQPGDEADFRRLNEEWIVRYFGMEQADEDQLAHPRERILEPGGRIFFAIDNGTPVGCCALLAVEPGHYELVKMAVTESCRGQGVGRKLVEHAVECARALGATHISLETNSKLTPAVRLYEAAGFRHIPRERFVPSPYARCNVQMEMELDR